jgi:hypothetical protein
MMMMMILMMIMMMMDDDDEHQIEKATQRRGQHHTGSGTWTYENWKVIEHLNLLHYISFHTVDCHITKHHSL